MSTMMAEEWVKESGWSLLLVARRRTNPLARLGGHLPEFLKLGLHF
jgi:hypothetical protein